MKKKKEIIVEIENSKGYKVTFDLFDDKIIEAAGFDESEIRDAIPVDTFFYFPGSTYPETTTTGKVLARPEHPWGGSLGVNMLIQNILGTISLQVAPAHDTYGHRKGPLKGVPHWNVYLKIIDQRRGYTSEDPLVKRVPWDWVHTLNDSNFLDVSMTPINPKEMKKQGRINHPFYKP